MADSDAQQRAEPRFRHRALIYGGMQGFLEGSLPFVRAGLQAQEPTLVMVGAEKIELLREALNGESDRVLFADMAEVGPNPARIIPAWRRFVDEHGDHGAVVRGIGEPVWAGLSPAGLVESQRHESLVNLAFAETESFELLCPYDMETLAPEVIDEVGRSHPYLVKDAREQESAVYLGREAIALPFDDPLPDAPAGAPELRFGRSTLFELRGFVRRQGSATGVGDDELEDFVTAVNEVATNSVLYAGGSGTAKLWPEDTALICEVSDSGKMDEPLAGRVHPGVRKVDGRGLWLANQLCDLIQIRSFADGTVTRVHARRGA